MSGTPPFIAPPGAPSAPPPPPTTSPLPPPLPPRPTPVTARRRWRDRVPELIAMIGASLVAAAVAGFLSSTWEQIGQYEKALLLAASSAALTAGAVWAEGRDRRAFDALVPLLGASATATLFGALALTVSTRWPGHARASVAAAGLLAAGHAGWMLWRRRDSILHQMALLATLVAAAGPFGTAIGDRWTWSGLADLGLPVSGILDLTQTSDRFVITGAAHALIGVLWLALAHVLDGRARVVARVAGSAVLAFAALELNVLSEPTGAVVALLIVLGYLVYGLIAEDPMLVAIGSGGALVAGVRVIWALFSGEVAATITALVAGLLMIGWAVHATRRHEVGA